PIILTGPWFGLGTPFGVVKNFDFFNPLAYPLDFYWLMAILIVVCIVLATNLQNSRIGRAWMAVREDEVAAAASGVNTVAIKLTAFAIGASFAGFAGAFYGAQLSLVSSDNFEFIVSVTILVMVLRPQGLFPSRVREQELEKGTEEQAVFDLRAEET